MSTRTDTRPSTGWEEPNAVQIKVALDDIEPPIWRRLIVPLTTTLSELHNILQAAMGWTDSHLHQFEIGGLRYGDLDMLNQDRFEGDAQAFDASEVRLRDSSFVTTTVRSSSTFTTSATTGGTPCRSRSCSL